MYFFKYIPFVILLWPALLAGQSNLLPNGDFEIINVPLSCQNQFSALHWSNPTLTSPDIFSLDYPNSDCNSYQIPSNWQGFQFPRSGNNYTGIISGVINFQLNAANNSELKEYIQAQLSTPLVKDKRYCVGGFTSLANLSQSQVAFYATQGFPCCETLSILHLGALFSNTKDFYNTYETIQNADVIDLYRENNDFLNDTSNWMQIESPFLANGGEEYLIYGNFKNSTDAQFELIHTFDLDSLLEWWAINQNTVPGRYVYYYFDDMYVYEIPTTKIKSEKRSPLQGGGYVLYNTEGSGNAAWYALPDTVNAIATTDSLFVNPLSTTTYLLKRTQCRYTDTDTLTLTVTQPPKPTGLFVVNNLSQQSFQILYYERAPLQLYLYNSAGQLIKTQSFSESTEINIADLAAGVYYCRIMNGDSFVMTERVVKN